MESKLEEAKKVITFDNLIAEVIEKGLCNRCGGCVSFCSANRLGAIEMGDNNLPRYVDRDKCLECGICYLICPQTRELEEELREKFGWHPPIGPYQDIFSARATNADILKVSTDGGVVTALLLYMLENNLINGAVVSKRTGLFSRKPIVATTRDELIEAAGSQFSESSHLEKLGNEYTTYVPVAPVIREYIPKFSARLAVVGTPCQIRAIRKMQVLKILPSDVIKFTIGLFCMESFMLNDLIKQKFARKHSIHMKDIVKLNVKEDFILTMRTGITLHIPFDEVDEIARPACLTCQDFANDYADISVGGLGSPDGYTTTLVRTSLGRRVYVEAMQLGYIEERTNNMQESIAEKARMISLITLFAKRKKQRGEKRLSKIK